MDAMYNVGKVLIIDDEVNLRNTLARILHKTGCETIDAENGSQALQILSDQDFDLVYLDIHLPDYDGMQILREIRQLERNLPVIILTGFGSTQSAVEALRLGATDYLLKPFDPEVLVAQARVVLREKAIERRKQEIREQIDTLQKELQILERESPAKIVSIAPATISEPIERYFKLGRLILDLTARRATFGDRVLNLTPSAFDYLVVLSKRSPEVVIYQTLVAEAQNYQVEPSEARELAKWHVHGLRQAMEDNAKHPRYILNVRGVGYRLLVD